MENNNLGGAHTSEQVHTSSDVFGDWLTVQEAVAYCLSKGLNRTPKTVRKWAQRARDPQSGTAEIEVKAQDTENGFRWLIGRASLEVKIEQEKQFAERKDGEEDGAHLFAQVATGAHTSEQVRVKETTFEPMSTGAHTSEQVATGAHPFTQVQTDEEKRKDASDTSAEFVEFLKQQLDRAEKQNDVKDRQIDALLERDRETNILIQGLQSSLTGVVNALPSGRREERHERQTEHRQDGAEQNTPTHLAN